MSFMEVMELTSVLLAVVAIIQSMEFLYLKKFYSEGGIWRWSELQGELTSFTPVRKFFGFFLSGSGFFALNLLRIIVALGLFITAHWLLMFALLVIHFLTLIRWRGTFNGGSDYMNLLTLIAATIALAFPENFAVNLAAMGYITFQLMLSYFKAGLLKLKNPTWRDGRALREFLNSPIYQKTRMTGWLGGHATVVAALGWAIILFEVLFPLALSGPRWALWFMGLGVFFHLGNVFIFGLNRFLWSWLAAYPSLYFCSLYLSLRL